VGKKGVNLKRIGAKCGCKIIFNPRLQCFVLNGTDREGQRRGKHALLELEAKFNLDHAHWSAERERRRRTEQRGRWELISFYQKQQLAFPEPDTWKEDALSLWRRHQRGKRKASNQHRQQITIDSARRSTAPRGRRSKVLLLDECCTSDRVMKRLLRTNNKRPARGANSQVQMQM
jgi:hypothetical protein